ncbi:MAG: NfeD family protein [Planktomarina sp.]
MWVQWWVWLVFALLLGIAELFAPASVLLGFAIGAALTAGALAVDFALVSASLSRSLVFFGAMSIISWLVLRQVMGVRKGQVKHFDEDIND